MPHALRFGSRGQAPSVVAAVIVKAMTPTNPRPRYLVGRDAKMATLIAQLPPRLRYRITSDATVESGVVVHDVVSVPPWRSDPLRAGIDPLLPWCDGV
jgi:hypothetical protein